jgi:hypothetical protein
MYHTLDLLKSSFGRYLLVPKSALPNEKKVAGWQKKSSLIITHQDEKIKSIPEETGVSRIPRRNRQPKMVAPLFSRLWANVRIDQQTSIQGIKYGANDGLERIRIDGIWNSRYPIS